MVFGSIGSLAIGAIPDRVSAPIPPVSDSYVSGGGGSKWDDRFLRREPFPEVDGIPEEQMLAVLLAADEYFFG